MELEAKQDTLKNNGNYVTIEAEVTKDKGTLQGKRLSLKWGKLMKKRT